MPLRDSDPALTPQWKGQDTALRKFLAVIETTDALML